AMPEARWTPGPAGAVVLEVRGLSVDVLGGRGGRGAGAGTGPTGLPSASGPPVAVDGVDLDVRAGEVLAIAGVDGNGQAELVLALAGLLPADAGTVRIRGRDVTREGPRERIDRGEVAHVPADRHRHAVLLDASAA